MSFVHLRRHHSCFNSLLRGLWGCAQEDLGRADLGRKDSPMCDFSLQSVRSRPAKVGDKLVTRDFGTGTRGFAASDDPGLAVCVLPGTELAFAGDVACLPAGLLGWKTKTINHQTAIFRQVNKDKLAAHHDALEFPGWAHRAADAAVRRSGGNRAAIAGSADDCSRGARTGACGFPGLIRDRRPDLPVRSAMSTEQAKPAAFAGGRRFFCEALYL